MLTELYLAGALVGHILGAMVYVSAIYALDAADTRAVFARYRRWMAAFILWCRGAGLERL